MSPHASGTRAEARAKMEAAILAAGRRQLIDRGAAALSLREVARSVGVVSSAVYRYVESRDALLTLLVVDAYTQLADSVDQALASAPPSSAGKVQALGHAMRAWAVEHPDQWGLIYGAPVPGYSAPADTTFPGTRVMARLLEIASAVPLEDSRPSPELTQYIETGNTELASSATTAQASLAMEAWCAIVGTISMEVFGQLGPEPRENPALGREILDAHLTSLSRRFSPDTA